MLDHHQQQIDRTRRSQHLAATRRERVEEPAYLLSEEGRSSSSEVELPSGGGAKAEEEQVKTQPNASLKKPQAVKDEEESPLGGSGATPGKVESDPAISTYEIPTPRELRRRLRRYVAGCDDLLRDLSTFAHQHLKKAGSYFAVPYVREVLGRHFEIKEPESTEARNLLYGITRVARNNQIRMKKDGNVYKDVHGLLSLANEAGIIVPKEEPKADPTSPEAVRRAEKKAVGSLVTSISQKRQSAQEAGESFKKEDLKRMLERRYELPANADNPRSSFARWLTRFHKAVAVGDSSVYVDDPLWSKVEQYLIHEKVGRDLKSLAKGGNGKNADPIRERTEKILRALRESQRRKEEAGAPPRSKRCLCVIGETGSGKTQSIRGLQRVMPAHTPVVMLDANPYTEAGYTGSDIADLPKLLLDAAGKDPVKASHSIVFMDEFDKKREAGGSGTDRDVSGAGVQHALLTMMEGGIDQETGVDFSTVSFVFGGSFRDLEKIVGKRTGASRIGFRVDDSVRSSDEEERLALLKQANSLDLEDYGMVREWVGRVSLTFTDPVTQEQMRRIMHHPQSPYREVITQLAADDIQVEVTPEAEGMIVQHALALHEGARGLGAIMERLTVDERFRAPELQPNETRQCRIDEKEVLARLGEPPTR